MDRAGGKKVKPKLFADLSAEAVNSTQRWLDNQNQLLDQWLQVVRASGGADSLPDFDAVGVGRTGLHSTSDRLVGRLVGHE